MDGSEIAQFHRRNEYSHEAIHDCVHDVTCRHGVDHLHARIEAECCRASWEMTRRAQAQRADGQAVATSAG